MACFLIVPNDFTYKSHFPIRLYVDKEQLDDLTTAKSSMSLTFIFKVKRFEFRCFAVTQGNSDVEL